MADEKAHRMKVEIKPKVEAWKFLHRMKNNMDDAAKLTNLCLADKLLHNVWSDMDMSSFESCLVAEAIDRLKSSHSSTEGEEGEE